MSRNAVILSALSGFLVGVEDKNWNFCFNGESVTILCESWGWEAVFSDGERQFNSLYEAVDALCEDLETRRFRSVDC